MLNCLLCHSSDTHKIAQADSKEIVGKYLNTFKVDFSYLFKEPQIRLMECSSCGLRFYDPQVSGDEHFYSVLQKYKWYYREDKEEYDFAVRFVKSGDRILDVGCGKGEFKKFVPTAEFTGLEFSSDAIKSGTEAGCHILNQSVEEHAKQFSGQYDVVTAFQVLEHVTDIAEFINSCANCVKPGGKLLIAVPSEESYLQFGTNFILNMPPHHISRWTDRTLSNMAELISLELVEIYHTTLDELHVNSYFATLIERALSFKKNAHVSLINSGLLYKTRTKFINLLANRFAKVGLDSAWHGRGHTVIAIYQKPY